MTTLANLRRYAVSRSLFPPTTLERAIEALGFVQADPIRAPARAQDLTLGPRVRNYRAGDLERRYAALGIEEDVLINYGFVTRAVQALMHPRAAAPRARSTSGSGPRRSTRAQALLDFVRERGTVHPREVDAHFAHGTVTNYWGGSSSATTHLLDALHYKGWLRVARRDGGIRIYAVQTHGLAPAGAAARRARVDALVDLVVRKYAPLPAASLSYVVGRLRYAVPQWREELRPALVRARQRLSHARAGGADWYWPADESPDQQVPQDEVRMLAPFDPVVWDRRRFELLWQWGYRFEAYTPASKRKLGYYALPLLWRDKIIGWANLSVAGGTLDASFGYVGASRPRERAFASALDAELSRIHAFLGLASDPRP